MFSGSLYPLHIFFLSWVCFIGFWVLFCRLDLDLKNGTTAIFFVLNFAEYGFENGCGSNEEADGRGEVRRGEADRGGLSNPPDFGGSR